MIGDILLKGNPYRLLNASSNQSQGELRQRAARVLGLRRLNFPIEVPLSNRLGTDDLENINGALGILQTDVVQRLVWQFAVGMQIDDQEKNQHLLSSFANSYSAFVLSNTDHNAKEALRCWEDVYFDEYLDQSISKIVSQKELILHSEAFDLLAKAQNVVTVAIVKETVTVACCDFRNGKHDKSLQLIEFLVNSSFHEDIIAEGLAEFNILVDELIYELEIVFDEFLANWHPDSKPFLTKELVIIQKLVEVLENIGTSVPRWREYLLDYNVREVETIRRYAIKVHNEDDNFDLAIKLLKRAILQSEIESAKENLRKDLFQVQKNAKALKNDQKQDETTSFWQGLEPVRSAPALATCNGIGQMMYGRQPFPGDESAYVTTLYFVVMFIPIIPIRKYVVRQIGFNSYQFLAEAPLSYHPSRPTNSPETVSISKTMNSSHLLTSQSPTHRFGWILFTILLSVMIIAIAMTAKCEKSPQQLYEESLKSNLQEILIDRKVMTDRIDLQLHSLRDQLNSTDVHLRNLKPTLDFLNPRSHTEIKHHNAGVDKYNSYVSRSTKLRKKGEIRLQKPNLLLKIIAFRQWEFENS